MQSLLREHYGALCQRFRLPRYVHRAAQALATCRTAARGAHVGRCPEGHFTGIWYNSCRHRSCPQCGFLDAARWLRGRWEWLLPCPHYHVVFTVPSQLNELWLHNKRLLAEVLFSTVRSCLHDLLGDPRYLGARAGILATLHTWGRTLQLHPHLHCLVSAGGLDPTGTWRSTRGILVPIRPLAKLYRGRFLGRLEQLWRQGKLRVPNHMFEPQVWQLLEVLARCKWNPHVEQQYRHGTGVLLYLGRYVRGGPFRNQRLLSCTDGIVTFRYGDWRNPQASGRPSASVMSLPVLEFLRRLLLHVPPPNLRTVRGWGLYAHTNRSDAERAKQQINDLEPHLTTEHHPSTPRRFPLAPPRICPRCQRRLIIQRLPRDSRPPPVPTTVHA